jgi:outer membrane protein assembly factor BamB
MKSSAISASGRAVAVFLVAVLTACGGGQEAATTSPNPVALAASLTLAPSANSATPISASFTQGEPVTVTSTVTTAMHGTPSLSGLSGIALDGSSSVVAQSKGKYRVSFVTSASLAAGHHTGNVQFDMCTKFRNGTCAVVAHGSPILIAYTFDVTAPGASTGWNTFQGDAFHRGYVAVTLDPAKFAKAWEWNDPSAGRVTSVSIENGMVAVSEDKYFDDQSTYVLNKADGSVAWSHDFGYIFGLNPPALKDGTLYVAATGQSQDANLFAFDAQTGAQKFKSPFSAQWEHYLAPTIANGAVLTNGGAYGGIYSFSITDGAKQWAVGGPQEDMLTPAVSATDAYYYAYGSLYDINRADGSVRFSIADPQFTLCCYMQITAPILGTSGTNVIAFSGDQFSGMASSSQGGYDSRQLINFDLTQKLISWRTAAFYIAQPALANSTIYAGQAASAQLDAINEQDGSVQWSWHATNGDVRFCRNVVATQNLLFASTDKAVYAIDLATKQAVWSYPTAGDIALVNDTLVISEGCTASTGKLIAIRLN